MSDSLNCALECVGTCGAKTIGDDLRFVVIYSVIWVRVVSGTQLPSGWGTHLPYWGNVLEFTVFTVGSSVFELGV